jgi:hypothetical protein
MMPERKAKESRWQAVHGEPFRKSRTTLLLQQYSSRAAKTRNWMMKVSYSIYQSGMRDLPDRMKGVAMHCNTIVARMRTLQNRMLKEFDKRALSFKNCTTSRAPAASAARDRVPQSPQTHTVPCCKPQQAWESPARDSG